MPFVSVVFAGQGRTRRFGPSMITESTISMGETFMKYLAKGLELLGLLIVSQALLVGLMEETNAMTKELTLLLIGGLVFLLGYWFEG
jgi:hypothetical protein